MIHTGTCSWVYVCHTHCAYVHLACKPSDQACTATQLAALQWSEAHNGSKEGKPYNGECGKEGKSCNEEYGEEGKPCNEEECQQIEGLLVIPSLPKQSTSLCHTHGVKLVHTMWM